MELISRQQAIDAIKKNACNTQRIFDAVKALPPVEPKRGKWIYKTDLITAPTGYWECSECKEGRLLYEDNFCPHCGSDMREVTNGN